MLSYDWLSEEARLRII